MSKKNLSKKNSGGGSKKAGRIARAKARQEAYYKLSTAEQLAQEARNKAEYDSYRKVAG